MLALALHVVLGAGVSAAELDAALAPKLPGLVQIYKELHASPELSGREEKTAAKLASHLRKLGYQVTDHFGSFRDNRREVYGVVAVLKNGAGPTVLVRADMDALPVTEATGVSYASKATAKLADGGIVGVMHACGHDVHMTSMLGTAEMMVKLKDRWSGTLVLVGQQSEEVGQGADAVLGAGLYTKFGKPNYVIGLHADPEYPAGVITTMPGYMMANVDSFDITMRGVGGHGAYPNLVKDPVVMAAELIVALQTLVSRETQPGEGAVVTVGTIHGGTKRNIVPDEVTLQLTVRSYKDHVRKQLHEGIRRMANGIAMAAGVPSSRMPLITGAEGYTRALYNDPQLTARLMELWQRELGKDTVRDREPRMAGDDFAHYSLADHSIPGVYYNIGATDPKVFEAHAKSGEPVPSYHSALFVPQPDVTIKRGVQATVLAAIDLMKR